MNRLTRKLITTFSAVFLLNACAYKPTYIPPSSGKTANLRVLTILEFDDAIEFKTLDEPCGISKSGNNLIARLGHKSKGFYPTLTKSVSMGMPINKVSKQTLFYETRVQADKPLTITTWYINTEYRLTETCQLETTFRPEQNKNYEIEAKRVKDKCYLIPTELINRNGTIIQKPVKNAKVYSNEQCFAKR